MPMARRGIWRTAGRRTGPDVPGGSRPLFALGAVLWLSAACAGSSAAVRGEDGATPAHEENEARSSQPTHIAPMSAGGMFVKADVTAPGGESAPEPQKKKAAADGDSSASGFFIDRPLSESALHAPPVKSPAGEGTSPAASFPALLAALRARTSSDSPMPEEALSAWSTFLGEADEMLKIPPARSNSAALTALAAALEGTLELDEAHYRSMPPWLAVAVQARLLGIARKQEDKARILEAEAHAAARRRGNSRPGSGWQWPIRHPVITSDFGVREDPFTGKKRMHNGVDIRARTPERVEAMAPGTVTRSGENGGHGISVEVLHEGGFTSVYSHLSLALVLPGDQVSKGDAVGITGETGRCTGPHLHFEIWRGETPVNPVKFLKDEPAAFGCEEVTTKEGFWRTCGGGAVE